MQPKNAPIKIRRQHRRTMMMRMMPDCIEVYIPTHLDPESKTVRQFITQGLAQWEDKALVMPEQQTTREDILAMVDAYAARMNLSPGRVQLREMSNKWGSCSSKNNITLNTRLCWLPRHLAEYVVCHELAHLREFNHSKQFWAIMAEHMPDYKMRLDELREHEKAIFGG